MKYKWEFEMMEHLEQEGLTETEIFIIHRLIKLLSSISFSSKEWFFERTIPILQELTQKLEGEKNEIRRKLGFKERKESDDFN